MFCWAHLPYFCAHIRRFLSSYFFGTTVKTCVTVPLFWLKFLLINATIFVQFIFIIYLLFLLTDVFHLQLLWKLKFYKYFSKRFVLHSISNFKIFFIYFVFISTYITIIRLRSPSSLSNFSYDWGDWLILQNLCKSDNFLCFNLSRTLSEKCTFRVRREQLRL